MSIQNSDYALLLLEPNIVTKSAIKFVLMVKFVEQTD
jgi:hypothetical protein